MKPFTAMFWGGVFSAALASAVTDAETAPSLSKDWDTMSPSEKYCVVPSHQIEPACRWAGPSADEVVKSYRARKYDKALAGFAAAARAGHTWAMWSEGAMYWFGHGVEPNHARAYGLVKAAAELGDARASDLAEQMAQEMSGAELLRSERTTQEYIELGSASELALRNWASEQMSLVIDGPDTGSGSGPCSGHIPSIELQPVVNRQSQRKLPHYSLHAREEGRSADVVIAALVDASGKVCRAKVVDSLYSTSQMNHDAIDAIQLWSFDPPKLNGRPVESMALIKVQYRIKD